MSHFSAKKIFLGVIVSLILTAQLPPAFSETEIVAVPADNFEGSENDPLYSATDLFSQAAEKAKAILHEEIELERFNVACRLSAIKEMHLKHDEFFKYERDIAGLPDAEFLAKLAEHNPMWDEISVSNVSYEQHENNGKDATGVLRKANLYVKHQTDVISELMDDREQVVEKLKRDFPNSKQYAAAKMETKVLSNIRDLAISEFISFHSNARKFLSTQRSLYLEKSNTILPKSV